MKDALQFGDGRRQRLRQFGVTWFHFGNFRPKRVKREKCAYGISALALKPAGAAPLAAVAGPLRQQDIQTPLDRFADAMRFGLDSLHRDQQRQR